MKCGVCSGEINGDQMTGTFIARTHDREVVNFTLCYWCVMHTLTLYEGRKDKPQTDVVLES